MVRARHILEPWHFWARWCDKSLAQYSFRAHNHLTGVVLSTLLVYWKEIRGSAREQNSPIHHLQQGLVISPTQTSGQSEPGCKTAAWHPRPALALAPLRLGTPHSGVPWHRSMRTGRSKELGALSHFTISTALRGNLTAAPPCSSASHPCSLKGRGIRTAGSASVFLAVKWVHN